jgi:hypothetical protein
MMKNNEIDSPPKKENWKTPQVIELDIRSTETNGGAGGDGGFPDNAS